MADPIAPTEDQAVAVPPPGVAQPSVSSRNVVPVVAPDFQDLADHVANSNNPQSRVKVGEIVNKVTKETETVPRNVQPDWGAVFSNLLMRNYVGAYNAYNGGQKKEEEALSVNGEQYTKVYNSRGFTGEIFDSTGRKLSQQQVKDLYARGGLISQSDQRALQTSTWGNQAYLQSQLGGGQVNQFVKIQNNAYTAANSASASNNNAIEQIKLIKSGGIQNALDVISSLPPEKRAALLAAIARYNTVSKGTTGASTAGTSATSGTNTGANVGLDAGVSGGGRGGVGGNLSGNVGTSAGNQLSGSASARSSAEQTSGTSVQEQQNLQSTIMGLMGGAVKTPEEFNNLMRYHALDEINKRNFEAVPVDARPPGFQEVPEFDANIAGSKSALQNRVIQMKNNALTAAWTKFLYQNSRDILKNGGTIADVNMSDLQDKFQKSEVFQGINNKFGAALQYHMTGQQPAFAPGTILVDQNNKVIRTK
jgi:hypothetical protein